MVPDIHRKLPGRGVWVTASRSVVEEALDKKHFDRGFRQKTMVDADLPGLVSKLLEEAGIGLLAISRKAGVLVSGRVKVEELIRSGDAAFVLHTSDAKGDGWQKIKNAVKSNDPTLRVFEQFNRETLDRITDGANTAFVAVKKGGIAEKAMETLQRLEDYQETQNG